MRNLVWLVLFTLQAQATIFQPQPINQQVRESDGVFQGHYLRKKSIVLEDGRLATQMVFKMTREQGLQSELFGMDEIIVHYPGGKLGDRHTLVEGVPEFVSGEKVIVFIRSKENRYWGMNLGFGSFRVVNYGRETMLVNYIFPDNPKIGQVSLADFEKMLKTIKGSSFKTVDSIEYLTSKDESEKTRGPASTESKGQNRSIASSAERSENEDNRPQSNIVWLIGILSALGGLFRMYRQRPAK